MGLTRVVASHASCDAPLEPPADDPPETAATGVEEDVSRSDAEAAIVAGWAAGD